MDICISISICLSMYLCIYVSIYLSIYMYNVHIAAASEGAMSGIQA